MLPIRAISLESLISINIPVEVVWKALTDSEELTRWFPTAALVETGAGGKIWKRSKSGSGSRRTD